MLPAGVEKIEYPLGYGLLMPARLAQGEKKGPLIIFTHGNGEAALHWIPAFEPLRNIGISILLLEYPGYAGAPGHSSLDSIQTTILAAYDDVIQHPFVNPNQIIAYGRSIGGGAAALLAENRPIAALCLESSFSSLAKLVSEKGYPSFLLKDRYDNERIVRSLDIPVWLYHGSKDGLIPMSHSQTLNQAAADSVLLQAECGHNDCPRPWPALVRFIEKSVLAGSPATVAN